MIKVRTTRSAREGRRWLGLAALAVTAALVPAALALACNPQAYLTLGQGAYTPGDTVRVSGSFFKSSFPITVSLDRTGQSTTVQTTANGSFQTSFTLPGNAATGGYTVEAIGYENGSVVAGLPARASFTVGAPVASQPDPTPTPTPTPSQADSPQASQSAPAATAPAPATSRPAAPAAGKPSADFREPRVFGEPNVSTSTAGSSNSSKGSSSSSNPAAARNDRVAVGGRAVFGGSVAPTTAASTFAPTVGAPASSVKTTRGATGSRSSSASAPTSRQAASQTATDDVWGTQTAGNSPSVLPVAGDGVSVTSPRSGSQLALGIVLLGAGMLALLGGLAAGEARRRRVRVR